MELTEASHRAVESVARESYGRLVAYLCSRTRDPAGAQDALADALLAALTHWPRTGVPANPSAWLLTAARHRLTDEARRRQVRAQNATLLAALSSLREGEDAASFPDDRLGLMLVCTHPAIDPNLHTPLMLQTVLGLDAVAIGRAFLVSPETMGQRLVRAKRKIRRARIAFEIPGASELPKRLPAVLNAIYGAYGQGWDEAGAADAQGTGLADEALWLARVLVAQLPQEPEARALLALMLYCEARHSARRDADGKFVALSDQDCRRWNRAMIAEAESHLAIAGGRSQLGRFQLEAAIQSVHVERAHTGTTAWVPILTFYDRLLRDFPTTGIAVSHAAAYAEVHGATAGISLLDQIATDTLLGYAPYWALRAHLLARLGRASGAGAAFDRAIALTRAEPVRDFLLKRRAEQKHLEHSQGPFRNKF